MRPSSDIAFTPTVKAVQTARGSRESFAPLEARGGWRTRVTPEVAGFIGRARTAYLGTANADGQPYVQHRGGPAGFIRVIDEQTLGFADFAGNRQYVTTGNLLDNPKAFLFIMDYEARRRLKLWGKARAVDGPPELLSALAVEGYAGRVEQGILFTVEAWDTNCAQHIPQLFAAEDVAETLAEMQARIDELEARLAALTGGT